MTQNENGVRGSLRKGPDAAGNAVYGAVHPMKADVLSRPLSRNQLFMRGKVALWESGLLSMRELAMYEYLLLRQHRKDHAFPSLEELARVATNRRTANATLKALKEKLPEAIQVIPGKGRRCNSYYVTRYEDFPETLISKLQARCRHLRAFKYQKRHYTVDPQGEPQNAVVNPQVELLHGTNDGSLQNGTVVPVSKASVCANPMCAKPLVGIKTHPSATGPCCTQSCADLENINQEFRDELPF